MCLAVLIGRVKERRDRPPSMPSTSKCSRSHHTATRERHRVPYQYARVLAGLDRDVRLASAVEIIPDRRIGVPSLPRSMMARLFATGTFSGRSQPSSACGTPRLSLNSRAQRPDATS